VLASGLGACGAGGDSSPSASKVGTQPAQASPEVRAHAAEARKDYQQRLRAEAPTPAESEAREAATDFYAILGEEDAEDNSDKTTIDSGSFCDLMSEQARAQTVSYAKASSGIAQEWDCESAVALLVIRSKRAGGLDALRQARVIAVNAQGERATATVRFGKDGPATSVAMVEEDGEWKLAASPVPSVR
jgi:hypothetical protein